LSSFAIKGNHKGEKASLLCQNEHDSKTEIKIVRKDLLSKAYSINLLKSIMYKKRINETVFNNSNRRPLGMDSILYSRGVAEKFRKICKRYNITTIFKTKCTSGTYLRKTEPKLDKLQRSQCLYTISCKCERSYIGETGRPLAVRLKEHKYNSKEGPETCHGSGGKTPASHRGGPGSIPGQSMWDLWWTKWHSQVFRFSPVNFIPPVLRY
jgi:hypothetical protein